MHTVTSFHAGHLEQAELNAVMVDYFALERARIYRRLFVTRFALLAAILAIAGFGLRWLPPLASWFSIGLCGVAPAWAWMAELRHDWRLARRLNELERKS
jgi:hypothetical protein